MLSKTFLFCFSILNTNDTLITKYYKTTKLSNRVLRKEFEIGKTNEFKSCFKQFKYAIFTILC